MEQVPEQPDLVLKQALLWGRSWMRDLQPAFPPNLFCDFKEDVAFSSVWDSSGLRTEFGRARWKICLTSVSKSLLAELCHLWVCRGPMRSPSRASSFHHAMCLLLHHTISPRKLLWVGWKTPVTHLFMQPEDFRASLKVYVLKLWRVPLEHAVNFPGRELGRPYRKLWQMYPYPNTKRSMPRSFHLAQRSHFWGRSQQPCNTI